MCAAIHGGARSRGARLYLRQRSNSHWLPLVRPSVLKRWVVGINHLLDDAGTCRLRNLWMVTAFSVTTFFVAKQWGDMDSMMPPQFIRETDVADWLVCVPPYVRVQT